MFWPNFPACRPTPAIRTVLLHLTPVGRDTGVDKNLVTLGSPEVITGAASPILESSATVYGNVEGETSDVVSGCTFEYVDQADIRI